MSERSADFKEEAFVDSKLKALKRLRQLPRGVDEAGRIHAITKLLTAPEVYATIRSLRWPENIHCPRCHSNHIVKRPQNPDNPYLWQYECLNCTGRGLPNFFNDLTNLDVPDTLKGLTQWILCWYLLGFCAMPSIAKLLGVSLNLVGQIANLGQRFKDEQRLQEAVENTIVTPEQKKKKEEKVKKKAEVEDTEALRRKQRIFGVKPLK